MFETTIIFCYQTSIDNCVFNILLSALEKSIELAKEIASFPEMCMLADRRSAIYNTYTRNSFDDSLEYETENGKKQTV